jgi:hypothetical protein
MSTFFYSATRALFDLRVVFYRRNKVTVVVVVLWVYSFGTLVTTPTFSCVGGENVGLLGNQKLILVSTDRRLACGRVFLFCSVFVLQ